MVMCACSAIHLLSPSARKQGVGHGATDELLHGSWQLIFPFILPRLDPVGIINRRRQIDARRVSVRQADRLATTQHVQRERNNTTHSKQLLNVFLHQGQHNVLSSTQRFYIGGQKSLLTAIYISNTERRLWIRLRRHGCCSEEESCIAD